MEFGYSWAAYKAIEEDMMRVIEYIPLETRQYDVYSFKLTDIIIRSCSHIDSLFKDILRNRDLSDHPNQQKITESKSILEGKKKGMLKIADYIEIFADYLNLAPVEVIIRRNNDRRRPFKEFENPGDKTPTWWRAYNDLKHDFYSNIDQGTLENALASLSALFVLNCQSAWKLRLQENINYLVLNRVITSPNFIHTGHLLNYIKKHPKLGQYNLLAQTDLFEYWLSYNEETIGDIVAERLVATESMRIPVEEDKYD